MAKCSISGGEGPWQRGLIGSMQCNNSPDTGGYEASVYFYLHFTGEEIKLNILPKVLTHVWQG